MLGLKVGVVERMDHLSLYVVPVSLRSQVYFESVVLSLFEIILNELVWLFYRPLKVSDARPKYILSC